MTTPELSHYLVMFADDEPPGTAPGLFRQAGMSVASRSDLGAGEPIRTPSGADGLLFDRLGIAMFRADAERAEALRAAGGGRAVIEPDRTVYALTAPAVPPAQVDETTLTWGLQAVGAPESEATGSGIRVAVLDTGFATAHPDFTGRAIVTDSFVDGEDVEDGHGHGTHCIGTACGPREPEQLPGYGVAHEAEIYAGKVLGNEGSGSDSGILSGIEWAIENDCHVVSMSLGAATQPGDPHSRVFETAARRAMQQGTLIIAAAGNESRRSEGHIAPVGHPANCPSIMAIGAVDVTGAIADFSCGSVDPGRAVDLAGPGVDVHSSWPLPDRYNRISGTSMATPHASGVAALLAQRHGARGMELWARLAQTALRLELPSTDVGAGLVRAP